MNDGSCRKDGFATMKYERTVGYRRAIGSIRFNSTATMPHKYADRLTHTENNCRVVMLPAEGSAKPAVAVIKDGEVVFRAGARHRNAYQALTRLVGKKLSVFSWKKTMTDDGDYSLRCSMTVAPPEILEPAIEFIVLDTETTGLDPKYDEILQLSIISDSGVVLWNQFYKPQRQESWIDAEMIHHISPRLVANQPPISDDISRIQNILDRARLVYAFNAPFDIAFLGMAGLYIPEEKIHDTMREYGMTIHDKPFIKLVKAASEIGYRYEPHDALADCQATLAVQHHLLRTHGVINLPVRSSPEFTSGVKTTSRVSPGRALWRLISHPALLYLLAAVSFLMTIAEFDNDYIVPTLVFAGLGYCSQRHRARRSAATQSGTAQKVIFLRDPYPNDRQIGNRPDPSKPGTDEGQTPHDTFRSE